MEWNKIFVVCSLLCCAAVVAGPWVWANVAHGGFRQMRAWLFRTVMEPVLDGAEVTYLFEPEDGFVSRGCGLMSFGLLAIPHVGVWIGMHGFTLVAIVYLLAWYVGAKFHFCEYFGQCVIAGDVLYVCEPWKFWNVGKVKLADVESVTTQRASRSGDMQRIEIISLGRVYAWHNIFRKGDTFIEALGFEHVEPEKLSDYLRSRRPTKKVGRQ